MDLRSRGFGFAVFEGHRQLLDYGTRSLSTQNLADNQAPLRSLLELIRLWSPSAIIIKKERWEAIQSDTRSKEVAAAIVRIAGTCSLSIKLLEQKLIEATFKVMECTNKYDIAQSLARIFPELTWQVPPARKPWESEHHRMSIFDAIALGLASWQHPLNEISIDQPDEITNLSEA
jgi:hypothetical protein